MEAPSLVNMNKNFISFTTIQIIITLNIEFMEKNFKNITNLTPKSQADRIKQI